MGDVRPADSRDARAFERLTGELEAGLDAIDFAEVTLEDRRLFVEHCVRWQVRCALRAGRFALAAALQRFALERIVRLERATPRTAVERHRERA